VLYIDRPDLQAVTLHILGRRVQAYRAAVEKGAGEGSKVVVDIQEGGSLGGKGKAGRAALEKWECADCARTPPLYREEELWLSTTSMAIRFQSMTSAASGPNLASYIRPTASR